MCLASKRRGAPRFSYCLRRPQKCESPFGRQHRLTRAAAGIPWPSAQNGSCTKTPPDLKTALEGRPTALRRVLDFVEALERGEWDTCRILSAELGLEDATVTKIYRNAVAWAMESFGGAS